MIELRRRALPPCAFRDDLAASDFERLGGEDGVRVVVEAFLERIFRDPLIGFFFHRASRARVRELEVRFAVVHLGGPAGYRGRSMREAHEQHRIFEGQFERRMTIVRETLQMLEVPADIARRWVATEGALRGEVCGEVCP